MNPKPPSRLFGNQLLLSVTRVLLLYFAAFVLAAAAEDARAPLTRIADIRRLSREDAAQALPVRISGVSLWTGFSAVVVDDGEESIWVPIDRITKSPGIGLRPADFEPGNRLEIEGVTDPGGYAPVVVPTVIRCSGTLPIRPARRVSVDRLLAGGEDGQRLEIEGVVQEMARSSLGPEAVMISMITNGNFCRVFVANGSALKESGFIDARVRVRGIFAPDHNARGEAVNFKLLTTSVADFDILTQPPADPFRSPRVPLDRLALFSPDAAPWHRKVVSGVVVLAIPGQYLFLQDGERSVRIHSTATGLRPGMRVEAAGFLDRFDSMASIRNALVRSVGEAPLPEPVVTTPDTILHPYGHNRRSRPAEDLACRMVQLRGRIQRIDWERPGSPKAVWISSEDRLFPAYLPMRQRLDPEQIRTWVPGALGSFTGVCELKFTGADKLQRNYTPEAFHLLMPGPGSIEILELPPWWTPPRTRFALAAVLAAALLLLLWVGTLRRQVKRQSRVIGDKIAAEAVQEERTRIARDLHDSIEQQLTGVSLHLYGARASIASDPGAAAAALDLARQMLKHSRREARNSIRDLRSPLLERRGLADALRRLASDSASQVGPRVETRLDEWIPGLDPDAEYQLLRLAQEALANALKHSRATRITLALGVDEGRVRLRIADDGCGFLPDFTAAADLSHFGMLGMRERAAKIGADLDVDSSSGRGTTVTVTLPPRNP
ncbi:MAG: sensor histidine kinase [Verrucomicrobia bacterium]|nr:MAG: sensor histidine kinase [Verrucomicrobiota bacterium]